MVDLRTNASSIADRVKPRISDQVTCQVIEPVIRRAWRSPFQASYTHAPYPMGVSAPLRSGQVIRGVAMPILTNEGASIAYTDTGAPPGRPDAPTVVFGHGLLFSGWMFSAQIEMLRGDHRCVAIDWRGQGSSPPAAGGYDMDTLSRDAIALIEHLGAAPVHYVGLSMGGFVGQRV